MICIHNNLIDLKEVDSSVIKTHISQCYEAFPCKKYQVIYVDPPWKYGSAGPSIQNQCENIYPTMTHEDLKNLPIKNISDKDSAIFLWTSNPKLPDAICLIKEWGFEYKTVFKVWRKTNNDGTPVCVPGWWSRSSTELLLVGAKGTPLKNWKTTNNEPQEYASTRTYHSEKPLEIRESVKQFLNVENRIELFARSQDSDWDAWGLEIPGFYYDCKSIANTIVSGNYVTIGVQCEILTDKSKEIMKKRTKKVNNSNEKIKSTNQGGFKHHKSDCSCCVCKNIRLRREKIESISSDNNGTS